MNDNKLIVALLLIAIIFSVITLVIIMNSDMVVKPGDMVSDPDDVSTASVVLQIIKRPSSGGA